MDNCKWLPKIVECKDYTKWEEYLDCIYEIFKNDFIDSKPIFEGKSVNFRRAPMDGKFEHTFIHLTHKDEFHKSSNPNDRMPDPRRAERIGWNRAIIDNYECKENCDECDKILYFEEYYKKRQRICQLRTLRAPFEKSTAGRSLWRFPQNQVDAAITACYNQLSRSEAVEVCQ